MTLIDVIKGMPIAKKNGPLNERTVEFAGAEDGDRTRDPNLGKVVLYL